MSDLSQAKLKKSANIAKIKCAMYAPLQQGRRPSRSTSPAAKSLREPPRAVYALAAWSVRKVNCKWYIAPTARFQEKPAWGKAYETLQRATAAIARKLAEEALGRHKRRREYNGISN